MSRNVFFYVGLVFVALILLVVAGLIVTRLTPQPALVSTSPAPVTTPAAGGTPDVVGLAEQASNSANLAANAASSIMSFIQSTGAILGLLLVGGAVGVIGYLLSIISRYENELGKLQKRSSDTIRALTLLQLGRQQIEFQNHRAAIEALEEAYRLDSSNQAVNYFLGELYLLDYKQPAKLRAGIEHLQRAVAEKEGFTRYPSAEAALAYALRLRGQEYPLDSKKHDSYFAQAEALFTQALDDNPNLLGLNGESWYGALGNLYRQQERYQKAIACYEQAEKSTRDRSYPINNLAILYFLVNDPKATSYFERSAKMAGRILDGDPFNKYGRFDLITAQVALGKSADAEANLNLILEQGPGVEMLTKFLDGLLLLAKTNRLPAGSDQIIARVRQAQERSAAVEESPRPSKRSRLRVTRLKP